MTPMTYTTAQPTLAAPKLDPKLIAALKSVRHFLAVCVGVYAEEDSGYRGLDLYGKPIWVKKPNH